MQTYGLEHSVSSWYGALLMGIISSMSLYMVALIFVRMKFFRSIRVDSDRMLEEVRRAMSENDVEFLGKFKGQRTSDPPIRVLVATAISNRDMDPSDMQELLKVTQMRQRQRLERGLSVFGTLASIGPFLGLLATVLGIIESFHNMGATGSAGPNVVASGVAAALWGTAAGLVVAIPSVIAYNVFGKIAKGLTFDMELAIRELIVIFKVVKKAKAKV